MTPNYERHRSEYYAHFIHAARTLEHIVQRLGKRAHVDRIYDRQMNTRLHFFHRTEEIVRACIFHRLEVVPNPVEVCVDAVVVEEGEEDTSGVMVTRDVVRLADIMF